jgi:DNA end-binding protein Ku
MWKGAIQFGLVTIPVKLYLATESKYGVSFNMLHAKDQSRIQMKVWCPVDEKVISRSDTVKGYEWSPDQYVVITDEDLEKVPLKTVRAIEIEQFTKADDAEDGNVKFVKQAYYIEPDKIGRKAFYLLKSVLEEEELTAICKVVIKDREALAALDPFGKTLLLTTLHWPDEIRALGDLELPEEEYDFKPAEKAMAKQLVAAMTGEFEPQKYKDEYRDALMKIIEQKVEGKEIVEPEPVEETGKLIDLMAALEASVNAAKTARGGGKEPVSVAAAKKERAGRTATAATAKAKEAPKKAARASARSRKGAEEELEEARPARRRRSA